MKCPFCENQDTKVINSRATEEDSAVRRRRECGQCKKRFTTYEKVEDIPLIVIKKDGSRESFDSNKIINGMLRACEKRQISLKEIETVANDIERKLSNMMEKEIESEKIGEIIMENLKNIDEVAYVRFASVYRQFKDINTFVSELEKLLKETKN